MNNQLKRIIELAKKTGDRLIITDSEGQNAFVVMNLDEYEGMIDKPAFIESTETIPESVQEANSDVSAWKSSAEEVEEVKPEGNQTNFYEQEPESSNIGQNTDIEDDERFYFEPVE